MHLGAAYVADPRAHEERVCAFLRSIASDAAELYILGDALDYWYEYRHVVPRGHVRFFGELARLADAGVKITWITGNHDIWLFDYLRDEIGIEVVDAPMVPRRISGVDFVLAHGDRLGRQKTGFRFICRLFRNRVCQRLYSAVHPGLTVPFARRWSSHSRMGGEQITREEYETRLAPVLRESCRQIMERYPATRHIVLGHHHFPLQDPVDDGRATLTVLGDWLEGGSYAVFDGKKLSLETF